MLGELELADDLGAEQRDHVGELAEAEPREDLLGDRRAAQHVPAFEHQDLAAGPGQVRGGREAVVPAPDDDRVVPVRHGRHRRGGVRDGPTAP